jgi:hypothetical protein
MGATFSSSLIGSPKYKGHFPLRCMWVLFGSFLVFPNFYRLGLHTKIHVALSNLQWNFCNIRIENRTSPYLAMVIRSACLFVDFLIGYIGPPVCVHY